MQRTNDLLARTDASLRAWRITLVERLRAHDERGEGVISMAIAVLIVAFLGAAAWLAFKGLLDGTKDKAETQIARVGA
jgi:hypothetical protein